MDELSQLVIANNRIKELEDKNSELLATIGVVRWKSEKARADTLLKKLNTLKEEKSQSMKHHTPQWVALQRLWTKALGTPDYDKKQWQAFERLICGTQEEKEMEEAKMAQDTLDSMGLQKQGPSVESREI